MKTFFKYIGFALLSLVIFILILFLYFNLPGPKPREDVTFGITFSDRYAQSLGLEWKTVYTALLDDMKVRNIRLPLYWDVIESKKGEYNFTDIDWQLAEAKKRNAKVILAMGQKVPRWPECYTPEWVRTPEEKRERLLAFEKVVVERYESHDEVTMWQIENEPFLKFGNCPDFSIALLDEEVALVRSLGTAKPILTTDSGELSVWFRAAARGDQFGTTLYRDIHTKPFGYITYPVGPNFFIFKEMVVRALTDQKNFMVIELQAEPWASGWVADASLEEQFITMDENKLVANIEYAKQVGFPSIYLWGAEWWYWMKEVKQYPAVWDTAKMYFAE